MINDVDRIAVKNIGNPLISVLLPVYNGEQYLAEAIASVLAQTINDFELIMIDDGSTDGSLKIMRKFENSDSRVRVVVRENRGLVASLNDLIDIAHGAWLARMDQDDIALPFRFERQLAWLNETNADISGSWVKRFGTSDNRIVKTRKTHEAIGMEMLFCSPFAHPSVMMRADLAKRLRYSIDWETAEDYDLWERAAVAGYRMTNVQEVLLMYRVHKSQISIKASSTQRELTQCIKRRYWMYLFGALNLDRSYIDEVLRIDNLLNPNPNMISVNKLFGELLRSGDEEAQNVIYDHVTRIYFRVAANSPGIIARWLEFNRENSRSTAPLPVVLLLFLRIFRVQFKGKLFGALRKLYVSVAKNTGA